MTAHDAPEDDDEEILALLSALELRDARPLSPATPPPRTPSPQPPAYTELRHTFPSTRARTYTNPSHSATAYYYESPTARGTTAEWAIAGAATQGVAAARVHAVTPKKKKKSRTKKAAYAVFCGKRCGVFQTWEETEPLVSGVPNCIFRGYATVADARSAFSYAQDHSWTRVADPHAPVLILPPSLLPQPTSTADPANPLNGSEVLNDLWYVVYRGICPGVYRSHLESQLNTLGVRRSLHESVPGESAARRKYFAALQRGDVEAVPPSYQSAVDFDPFI